MSLQNIITFMLSFYQKIRTLPTYNIGWLTKGQVISGFFSKNKVNYLNELAV